MRTIQIELGGEMRTLDFSRNGFYEHVQNVIGDTDVLQWMENFKANYSKNPETDEAPRSIVSQMRDMAILTYGAYNAHQDDQACPQYIDFDDVKRWIRAVKTEQTGEVVKALFSFGGGEEKQAGEQKPQEAVSA